jgi:hypothetical protein
METLSRDDTDALLLDSQAQREAAERLLDDLQLIERWREYGTVELTGSYQWNLMLDSDIDLVVVNPASDLDLALAILTRFAHWGPFLRFGFIDSVRGKPSWNPTYPEGYYLGMAGDFDGREWKVETWLLRTTPPPQEWIRDLMTEEGRRTILRLKHLRRSGAWRPSSFDIYRAVLRGGAQDSSEVDEWLRRENEQHSEGDHRGT